MNAPLRESVSRGSASPSNVAKKKPATNVRQKKREEPTEKKKEAGVNEQTEEKSGTGVFIYSSGMKYEGQWEKFDDVIKRHGKGTLTDNGRVYSGDWKEDVMQGQGAFRTPSGASYEGEWDRNMFHGKGKYTWPDGSFYEGEWVENKMHGAGCYTDTKGEKWMGTFYNNTGPGLITWYK